ncbi:MAG: ATP-dependent DNA helicase [Synergistaceae bacterium]|nr:ATP-dependent DNA helicase [Synergistaceae bacterium]
MAIPPMEDYFGPSGKLAAHLPNFEYRKPQADLALEVSRVLQAGGGESLAAEAPPGIGKTFALLVPAMLSVSASDKKILFLTAGIPLQEQLIQKDLPALNQALDLSLPFGLLKGKGNYACLLRASETLGETGVTEGYLSYGDGGQASMLIARWLEDTETVDLSELPLPPDSPAIARIAASSRSCLGFRCPFRDDCFHRKVLQSARDWSIVVANYHLYFSYLLGAGQPFPATCDIIICDEAHRMAEAARSSMTLSVSAEEFGRLMRSRVVTEGAQLLESGSAAGRISSLAGEIRLEAARFFDLLEIKAPGKKVPLTSPDDELVRCQLNVSDKVFDLLRLFDPLLSEEEDPHPLNPAALIWAEELRRARYGLQWCAGVEEYPSWAYWKEGTVLSSAPAAPFPELADGFFSGAPEAVFFISATMTIDGKWDYWMRETGFDPDRFLICDSPFDLENQMEILVVDTGIDVMNPSYDQTLCAVVDRLVESNGGATLVLLSSRRLLGKVAGRLRSRERAYSVLVQGELPRSELIKQFREKEGSVLVGMASFREGIDIPGEGLTQVVIDRIPFSHPADPIVMARNDHLGREAFIKASLPEAKILLKQAAGRLIRSGRDRGRVAIIDGRVLNRKDWNIPGALPRVKYRRLIVSSDMAGKSVAPA